MRRPRHDRAVFGRTQPLAAPLTSSSTSASATSDAASAAQAVALAKAKEAARTAAKAAVAAVAQEDAAAAANVYYANCDAVRAAGGDPISVGEPGYSRKLDPRW